MADSKGSLQIVSVHIGNPKDITLRAIDALREADLVVCEEPKEARRLLHSLDLQKELLPLNEHTTKSATEEVIELLKAGKNLALISDAGTPILADPGSELVQSCIGLGIAVTTLPGATSIIPALILSGFSSAPFTFHGFLPKEKSERKNALDKLRTRSETLILLEAPYRLAQILDEMVASIGRERLAAVCMDITMPSERVIRGTLLQIQEHFAAQPFKGEYVIVLKGLGKQPSQAPRPQASKPAGRPQYSSRPKRRY
jgi:16S rRNA (cytidine1402-2'-O)-methyltransferase